MTSRSPICASVSARPCVSTNPTTTSTPAAPQLVRLVEHAVRLADAGGRADVQLELPALALRDERQKVELVHERAGVAVERRQPSGSRSGS